MIKNFDLYNPDFVIDLRFLKDSASIYQIMRDQNIVRAYVYGMIYHPKLLVNDFLKVGMSAPILGQKREHQVGERIVRQVAWVPGWSVPHPYSGNGSEFWSNINTRLIPKQLLPMDFNKNMLKIAVWDVSKHSHLNVMLSNDDDLTLSIWAEGELAAQYKRYHNDKLPLLNVADPSKTKIYSKPFIHKDMFNSLFDV